MYGNMSGVMFGNGLLLCRKLFSPPILDVGIRLVDEFLAKSGINKCPNFNETAGRIIHAYIRTHYTQSSLYCIIKAYGKHFFVERHPPIVDIYIGRLKSRRTGAP